jgi:hypothetical protein
MVRFGRGVVGVPLDIVLFEDLHENVISFKITMDRPERRKVVRIEVFTRLRFGLQTYHVGL